MSGVGDITAQVEQKKQLCKAPPAGFVGDVGDGCNKNVMVHQIQLAVHQGLTIDPMVA